MRDPGIYYDVPEAEYHADEAISHSGLKHFARSPAHFQEWKRNPPARTDAMRFGAAYDCAVLEGPDAFNAKYFAMPPRPAGINMTHTKKDPRVLPLKELEQKCREMNVGKEEVPGDEYQLICNMASVLIEDDKAQALLSDATQVSIWWDDPETGVRCRGRLDAWHRASRSVVDLKTTRDASAQWFPRDAHGRGYHNQFAMYLEALEQNAEVAQHCVLIAQEKEPPYAIAKWELPEQSLAAGGNWYRHHIRNYARCLEEDRWPGYPEEIQMMEAPGWI